MRWLLEGRTGCVCVGGSHRGRPAPAPLPSVPNATGRDCGLGLVLGVCGPLVAVLGADHVLRAPVRLQGLHHGRVLRKLGLAAHQGTFLALVSVELRGERERNTVKSQS